MLSQTYCYALHMVFAMKNKENKEFDIIHDVENAIFFNKQAYSVLQMWIDTLRDTNEEETTRVAAVITLVDAANVHLKNAMEVYIGE